VTARWLFADQLGPHFDDGGSVFLVENQGAFRRRRYHRQKAHLLLSALRHRGTHGDAQVIAAPSYRAARAQMPDAIEVVDPNSFAARTLVREVGATVLPSRGFLTSDEHFTKWATGRERLTLEDWYREVRKQHGWLMDGDSPIGGRWNFDAENRQPPPRGAARLDVAPHWVPVEDDIDEQVRAELDRWEASGEVSFVGSDGPRWFPVTRDEALTALADFIEHRLPLFGPYEDAMMREDPVLAHSMLSVPLNLGLLKPIEVINAALDAFAQGNVPLASMEGFLRQIAGWREFVWHTYWRFGPRYVDESNALQAHQPLPAWFDELDADSVDAVCLSSALGEIRERGWSHHIIRLMVVGNWALQRGYRPSDVNDWFLRVFVDAFPWVMAANVVGMALFADGGRMSTKPYAAGGAYIKRMSNYCGDCQYRPNVRVGPQACPFTAGYWWFLDRIEPVIAKNHRMAQPRAGLRRLKDRAAVLAQEEQRGSDAP
jgi:deoxyribodipyrimidine photolyase-related protein